MGAKNSGTSGKGNLNQQRHDGQKNYQHSNQRNPDNIRDNTRDHVYKDYDEKLTNDENYNIDTNQIKGNPDFDDTKQNVDKHKSDNE